MSDSHDECVVALFDAFGHLQTLLSYGEFDAILFRAANLAEYANELLHGAYVEVSPQLEVLGAVFFVVRVDADGYVMPFDTPFDTLLSKARAASKAHPAVVVRENCPDPRFASDLWQPDSETVSELVEAIGRNELGLLSTSEPVPSPTIPQDAQPQASQPATLQGLLSELERARSEISRLRSALRHEQDRNRRLQDALLGDPRR